MPFTPIANGKYKSPSGRIFTAKQVKAYYATNGFTKNKVVFKHKVRKVDNKMRSFGDFNEATGKIRINKKMSKKNKKGNYPELLDTIVHEEYHKAHPKATEKKTYKVTKRIVKKLSRKAKNKLYARYK
ncbi:MAG: hypothetical protein ACREGC_00290 [Minisyncoccia bacterium]